MLNERIFREYDIRGVVGVDFTVAEVVTIGQAIGGLFREAGATKAVVGRDNRLSSPELAEALTSGLCRSGVDVVDIGMVPTPVFYFARIHLDIPAGVMVTASHNPPEHNGFKVGLGDGTWYGEAIQTIRRRLGGPFWQGSGRLSRQSVDDAYRSDCLRRVRLGRRHLKVVIDSGNGSFGPLARQVLEAAGVTLVSLCEIPDGSYPNHHPDPTVPENLGLLRRTVVEQGADVGLAFDGDGDRLGVVDETGRIVPADRYMLLFWQEILSRHPGVEALVEVKCSQVLFDAILAMGGKPRFCRTGHSLIKAEMRQHGLLFAGEMSGHMFFRDEHPGYDDGLYAGLRLLRILSETDKPLSALLARWPEAVATPELRLACPDEVKVAVVDDVREALRPVARQLVTVDGVRAVFPDGWGLVRVSNTQPALIVRAEAADEAALGGILRRLGEVLKTAYQRHGCPLSELHALEEAVRG